MTTILDPALDLSLAPLTNTPLTSTDTSFVIDDQAGDISNFPDPGALGYYAWVWARSPNFSNVGDANRAGVAERVRVTARDVGTATLTVTRGAAPIDLNASGVTYWIVAPMNADYIDKIDERLFDFVGGNLVTTKTVDVTNLIVDNIDLVAASGSVGSLDFLEDAANGTNKITLQAPASVTSDYSVTMLAALPGSTQFLQIDNTGQLSTAAASTAISLDDAYNEGTVITADAGPVEAVNDTGGFQVTGDPSTYLHETTSATYNFRMVASADKWQAQRGDQDTDASDDSWVAGLTLDGTNRRFAVNTAGPQDLIHGLQVGSGAARLRLQTGAASQDSSVLFLDQSTSAWEAGYDNSVSAFVVGRLSFANPVMAITDTTEYVGFGLTNPTAKVNILNAAAVTALRIDQQADEVGLAIESDATDNPLIDLVAVNGNFRGDINLATERTSEPASPHVGDVWFNNTENRIRAQIVSDGGGGQTIMGPWGPGISNGTQTVTIATGVATIAPTSNRIVLAAEFGTADNLDDIALSAGTFRDGDILLLSVDTGDTITVVHDGVNIVLDGSANKALNLGDHLIVWYKDGKWRQYSTVMNLVV
jgi:hypothetical protein